MRSDDCPGESNRFLLGEPWLELGDRAFVNTDRSPVVVYVMFMFYVMPSTNTAWRFVESLPVVLRYLPTAQHGANVRLTNFRFGDLELGQNPVGCTLLGLNFG
jgi:hypothetical protein